MHPCFQALKDAGFDLEHDLHVPIQITKDMQLKADEWAFRLEKTVMQGKRKRIEHSNLLLSFCPMCGERLIPEETK